MKELGKSHESLSLSLENCKIKSYVTDKTRFLRNLHAE